MPENILQSVDNALSILEVFAEEGTELGISELSRKLGLGKSTVFRLLTTLEARGFVVQNPSNDKYRLGIKVVNIGTSVLRHLNIIKECRPFLEELSGQTGESSHITLYSKGEITFLDKVRGNNPARMDSIIGFNKPAYITASGKVLLAHLSKEEQEAYLQQADLKIYTPHTITCKEQLRKELNLIEERGYSEDQQEAEEGLVCFGAPIRNSSGQVIAALSTSGAASRMNERKDELINLVKDTAHRISQACGWLPRQE